MRMNDMKKRHLFSSGEILLLIVLMLSFMDFRLYSLHLMVLALVFFCFLKRRLYLPNGVLPLVIFTVALFVFWPASFFSPTALAKRLVWPTAFLLGYNLILPETNDPHSVEKAEDKANIYIFLAAAGFFIHLALNLYMNVGQVVEDRNTLDFWSMQRRAATGQAALACVPLAWGSAYMVKEASFSKKVLVLLGIGMVMYYNLILGNRTMVLSFGIVIATAILYLLSYRGMTKKSKAMIGFVIIAIAVAALYSGDVWGIRSAVQDSVLFDRLTEKSDMGIGSDPRWRAKLNYIKLMPQYLFGGMHIREAVNSYAHDVLLDTYDEVGIFGFAAVVAVLWDGISKLRLLLRSRQVKYDTKVTLLCIYVSIFITFALEPIFAGVPWLLMTYCFLHGIVTGLVKTSALMKRKQLHNQANAPAH